jgi:hypothetical protein
VPGARRRPRRGLVKERLLLHRDIGAARRGRATA